jgi:hypothetical protein
MSYNPPSGWVEPFGDDGADSASQRFHARRDCPRIRHPEQLREVDRPYPGCAEAHGNNLEQFARA